MNKTVKSSLPRDREAEVLDAALSVFSELGFKKASMDDIAGRLGVTKAALYRYARDKRDLYRVAVARGFELWQKASEAAAAAEVDPVRRFRSACLAAFRYLASEPRLRMAIYKDPALFPLFEAEDPFSDINARSVGLIERLIGEGQAAGAFAPGDSRAAARVLFSLYALFIQKAYVAAEADEAALFERGLELVLDGLRSRSETTPRRAKPGRR